MHETGFFSRFCARLADLRAAVRRRSEFTCGDCERSDRCGRPPDKVCIVRAAQIARGDWKRDRHIGTLAQL
jgi:hypothetical protein